MNARRDFTEEDERESLTPIQAQIVVELYRAAKRLGADDDLLSLIGSWGDTMSEEDILSGLRAYNETGTIWKSIVANRTAG